MESNSHLLYEDGEKKDNDIVVVKVAGLVPVE